MRYVAALTYLLTMAALAAVVVLLADAHAWSDSATQWTVVGVLGVAVALELRLMRWRERRSRRRNRRDGSAHALKQ